MDKTEYEAWMKKMVEEANVRYALKAIDMTWEVKDVGQSGFAGKWSYTLVDKRVIRGVMALTESYERNDLSLAIGIGIEMHPFGKIISELLAYINTVALPDKSRNSLLEIVIRGFVYHVLSRRWAKPLASIKLNNHMRLQQNIDLVYAVLEDQKKDKHAEKIL